MLFTGGTTLKKNLKIKTFFHVYQSNINHFLILSDFPWNFIHIEAKKKASEGADQIRSDWIKSNLVLGHFINWTLHQLPILVYFIKLHQNTQVFGWWSVQKMNSRTGLGWPFLRRGKNVHFSLFHKKCHFFTKMAFFAKNEIFVKKAHCAPRHENRLFRTKKNIWK